MVFRLGGIREVGRVVEKFAGFVVWLFSFAC